MGSTFGLVDVKRVLKSNSSAIVMAGAGAAAIGGVKYALNAIKIGGVPLASKIPAALVRFTPLLASLVVLGGTLAAAGKSKKAVGFAVGAVSAGVTITVYDLLRSKFPEMGDLVDWRVPGMGLILPTSDRRAVNGMGLLTPDTGSVRLNALAQSAMGELVEYDVP